METWLSYSLTDFLMFSPRVYWRQIELFNEQLWPWQLLMVVIGLAVPVVLRRPGPWHWRCALLALAVAWGLIAWGYLQRYATINWAIAYIVPLFAFQAFLLAVLAALPQGTPPRRQRRAAGWSLLLYGVLLHPLWAPLTGESFSRAEWFGIFPDPTAIATLGALLLHPLAGWRKLLLLAPVVWCLFSGLTLVAMDSFRAVVPLAALAVTLAAFLWPRRR